MMSASTVRFRWEDETPGKRIDIIYAEAEKMKAAFELAYGPALPLL